MNAVRLAAIGLVAAGLCAVAGPKALAQTPYQGSASGAFTHKVSTDKGDVFLSDSDTSYAQSWNNSAQAAIKYCNKSAFDAAVAALRGAVQHYDKIYSDQMAKVPGFREHDLGELADKAQNQAQNALQDANTIASMINWLLAKKIDWAACSEALKKKYEEQYNASSAARRSYYEQNKVEIHGGFLGGGTIINSNDAKSTTGGAATGGSTGQLNDANNPFKDLPPGFTDHILDKQKTETPAPKPVPSPTPTPAPKTTPVTIGIKPQPTLSSPKVALETITHPTMPTTPTFVTPGATKPTPLSPVATKPPVTLQIPGKSTTPTPTASPCPPGQKAVAVGSRTTCVNAAAAAAVAAGAH